MFPPRESILALPREQKFYNVICMCSEDVGDTQGWGLDRPKAYGCVERARRCGQGQELWKVSPLGSGCVVSSDKSLQDRRVPLPGPGSKKQVVPGHTVVAIPH